MHSKTGKRILIVCTTLFISASLPAQSLFKGFEHLFTRPQNYIVYQPTGTLVLDGQLNERSWQKAKWSEYFVDIEGDNKPAPTYKTRFKMLWDADHLYIAAELEEPHIWATITGHDEVIYYDNDFEVFIDPGNDTHNYFETEINAFKTTFDLYLPKPYRNGGNAQFNWDPVIKSGIHINGTINNPADEDKSWVIEMAIPFVSLRQNDFVVTPPSDKTLWRINFSRVEWDIENNHGSYKKKTNPATAKPLPEHNWVWSAQGVINMHYPERWGYLQFSKQRAGVGNILFKLPFSEEVKKHLWLIYYKQRAYYNKHKEFAALPAQIDFPTSGITIGGKNATIQLSASSGKFTAYVSCEKETWQIDDGGRIIKSL